MSEKDAANPAVVVATPVVATPVVASPQVVVAPVRDIEAAKVTSQTPTGGVTLDTSTGFKNDFITNGLTQGLKNVFAKLVPGTLQVLPMCGIRCCLCCCPILLMIIGLAVGTNRDPGLQFFGGLLRTISLPGMWIAYDLSKFYRVAIAKQFIVMQEDDSAGCSLFPIPVGSFILMCVWYILFEIFFFFCQIVGSSFFLLKWYIEAALCLTIFAIVDQDLNVFSGIMEGLRLTKGYKIELMIVSAAQYFLTPVTITLGFATLGLWWVIFDLIILFLLANVYKYLKAIKGTADAPIVPAYADGLDAPAWR